MSRKPISKKPSISRAGGIDVAELERLLKLMDAHNLAELEVEEGDRRVSFRTRDAFSGAASTAVYAAQERPALAPAPSHAPAPPVAAASGASSATSEKQINSPFVGVFYRSSTPGGDPFVREGQPIKKGDVLCIVEAMKLMNEIEAEWAGKITKVLVENGQAVEFGEPLFSVVPA